MSQCLNSSVFRSLLIKLGMLGATAALVLWIGWPTSNEELPEGPTQTSAIPGVSSPVPAQPVAPAATRAREPRPSAVTADQVSSRSRLDLNRATAQELQGLPGIGEVLAKRIVEHRQTRGSFRSVEELHEVKGIGQKRLERLRPLLTAGGSERRPRAPSREGSETAGAGKTKL